MKLFAQKGKKNTAETISLALAKAKELGIKNLVVASHTGETAKLLLNSGLNIICVTHHAGFADPGVLEISEESRQFLESKGAKVLTTTHLLAGVDRACRLKFQGIYPAEIIASTLRMFGQGIKVCVEVAVMALDAGLIPHGEEIIAIGGTGKGADAALVIKPAHSHYIFDSQIKEIICMPRA